MSDVGLGKHALYLMMHNYAMSAREMHQSDKIHVTTRNLKTVEKVLNILMKEKAYFTKTVLSQKNIETATLLEKWEYERKAEEDKKQLAANSPIKNMLPVLGSLRSLQS